MQASHRTHPDLMNNTQCLRVQAEVATIFRWYVSYTSNFTSGNFTSDKSLTSGCCLRDFGNQSSHFRTMFKLVLLALNQASDARSASHPMTSPVAPGTFPVHQFQEYLWILGWILGSNLGLGHAESADGTVETVAARVSLCRASKSRKHALLFITLLVGR